MGLSARNPLRFLGLTLMPIRSILMGILESEAPVVEDKAFCGGYIRVCSDNPG